MATAEMSMNDESTIIKTKTEEMLGVLGISGDVAVRSEGEGEERATYILIEGSDMGMLIGYHGEGLYSFQLLLSFVVAKACGEWRRLFVDVAGWRASREEYLTRHANEVADTVAASGEPHQFETLEAVERRVIHVALSLRTDVRTESVGEGRDRRLMVYPH
ncbi:MAG: R3H domain-containing nucleic acid-binding protein [bacterium]|nr:R3H domain-containing nucleic acid-binding protein [bacterium]